MILLLFANDANQDIDHDGDDADDNEDEVYDDGCCWRQ